MHRSVHADRLVFYVCYTVALAAAWMNLALLQAMPVHIGNPVYWILVVGLVGAYSGIGFHFASRWRWLMGKAERFVAGWLRPADHWMDSGAKGFQWMVVRSFAVFALFVLFILSLVTAFFVEDYLRTFLEQGDITAAQGKDILTVWRILIPALTLGSVYVPLLRFLAFQSFPVRADPAMKGTR